MKKTIFLAVMALLAVSALNAQVIQKGDWAANVGISLDNTDPMVFGGSVERGIIDNVFNLDGLTFALGADASYASKSESAYGIKVSASALVIGIRAPFHYSPVAKLDLYTAPALYYVTAKAKVLGQSVSDSSTEFGWAIIGARYFFTQNIGAFLELGHNTSLGMGAGVAFKF